MMRGVGVLCCLLMCASGAAFAHGPSRVKLQEQIAIAAPAEKVWAIIADFCSIKDWNPLVTACESDAGNKPDSVRRITLDNGAVVQQKLAKYQADRYRMQYYMLANNPAAYPVNSHGVIWMVIPNEDGGATLQLKGNFYRLFPGPTPPAGQRDEDGKAALMRIARAGMENVKKLAEQ